MIHLEGEKGDDILRGADGDDTVGLRRADDPHVQRGRPPH